MIKLYDGHCHHPVDGEISSLCAYSYESWLTLDSFLENRNCFLSYGIHPLFIESAPANWMDELYSRLAAGGFGVGECGLHYRRGAPPRDLQLGTLRLQWRVAVEIGVPLTLHSVGGWQDIVLLEKEMGLPECGAVIHGFHGGIELAKQMLNRGFIISISPLTINVLSDRSTKLIRSIPKGSYLLESDREVGDEISLSNFYKRFAEIRGQDVDMVSNDCRMLWRSIFRDL